MEIHRGHCIEPTGNVLLIVLLLVLLIVVFYPGLHFLPIALLTLNNGGWVWTGLSIDNDNFHLNKHVDGCALRVMFCEVSQ